MPAGRGSVVHGLFDGKTVVPMASSQDHKRVFDGDKGPNTGGMGDILCPRCHKETGTPVMEKIMIPTVRAMEKEGRLFKGVLYAGLMIRDNEAKVLEFNARFGDPETQPIMARLETDIIEIIDEFSKRNCRRCRFLETGSAVCVVMASGGYPGEYEKGREISGLEKAGKHKNVMVFHSGTSGKNGRITTDGGRVLGVTGLSPTVAAAIDTSYAAVREIAMKVLTIAAISVRGRWRPETDEKFDF